MVLVGHVKSVEIFREDVKMQLLHGRNGMEADEELANERKIAICS